jgi:hypothetical protein
MPVPVLLVSTTTTWLGTARIPKGLADAGFEVSLLAPQRSLAEASRFIARLRHIDDRTTPAQWFDAFAAMVDATRPRLVIPCDDTAFELLASIATDRAKRVPADVQAALAELVCASLGQPGFFLSSVDKTLLPPLAEAIGVKVPAYSIVTRTAEAAAFASKHRYPIVLKRGHAFAGQGVAICMNEADLARALRSFALADARDRYRSTPGRFLAQAHVAGPVRYFHAVAWQGELVAGFALEKLVANPAPNGPPTITRYFAGQDLRRITGDLARAFGISGLFFAEFICDTATGVPLLIEINRRVSPATHRGAERNVNLCAALFAALDESASTSRAALDADEEGIVAHFPQEWLRDPGSPYLQRYPADVPWDEPELLQALLKLPH